MIVDGRREQLSSSRHEYAPRTSVMRLLYQHAVSRIQENAADRIQSLLSSVDDHNSLRARINSTQPPETSGDGFPELQATLRPAVVEITQRSIAGACAE